MRAKSAVGPTVEGGRSGGSPWAEAQLVEAGRARPLGKGAVNASAARVLVLLIDAASCGRRLEQSSDERARGGEARDLGMERRRQGWCRSSGGLIPSEHRRPAERRPRRGKFREDTERKRDRRRGEGARHRPAGPAALLVEVVDGGAWTASRRFSLVRSACGGADEAHGRRRSCSGGLAARGDQMEHSYSGFRAGEPRARGDGGGDVALFKERQRRTK